MYFSSFVALVLALLYASASASPVIPRSIIPATVSSRQFDTVESDAAPTEKRSEQVWIDEFDNIQVASDTAPVSKKSGWLEFSGSDYFASLHRQLTSGGNPKTKAHFREFISREYSNGVGFDESYVEGFFYGLVGVSLFCLVAALFYVASRYLVPSSLVRRVSRGRTAHRRGDSRWSL